MKYNMNSITKTRIEKKQLNETSLSPGGEFERKKGDFRRVALDDRVKEPNGKLL